MERPRVKKLVNPATLKLEDNSYARALVAYGFPASLSKGLLYLFYTEVSEAASVFKEVDESKAIRMVETTRCRGIIGGSLAVTGESQRPMRREPSRSLH